MRQHQRYLILNKALAAPYGVRLVLTWSTSYEKPLANRDLDLFVEFKIDDNFICSVGFYNPLCQGVMGNFDGQNSRSDITNAESVTFYTVGEYKYIVYVGEYLNKNTLIQPTIMDTGARIDMYATGVKSGPIAQFNVPY